MKITNESYEILSKPESNDRISILKHLEKIGRTCYKSEDKITDQSCIRFIEGIRNRKHWAMLEHYIFVFSIPKWIYEELRDASIIYNDVNYDLIDKMKFINFSETYREDDSDYEDPNYIVSFSATSLNYLVDTSAVKSRAFEGIIHLFSYMYDHFKELMKIPDDIEGIFIYENYDQDIRLLTNGEIRALTTENRLLHDSMSVKFIIPLSLSHEIVRHRPASFAQESTRYIKYSDELTFIMPKSIENQSAMREEWERQMQSVEDGYHTLLKWGAIPEQAASLLPKSLKTELIMTARMGEWIHFFDMRADKPAHAQMKEITIPMLKQCIDNDPYIFNELEERLVINKEFLNE